MKKTFLLILCFAFALTLFTISVSAYEFGNITAHDPIAAIQQNHIFGDEQHGNGEHTDGWYWSTDGKTTNDEVAKVKLKYNSTTVVFPTYYILKNDSTLNWDFGPLSTYLTEQLKTSVTLGVGNIVAIEIPYGITRIPEQAFVLPGAFVTPDNTAQYEKDDKKLDEHPRGYVGTANTALEYIFLSNSVLNIDDLAFAHCTSLATFASNHAAENLGGNHDHQMLQSIGYRAFHECAKLTDFNFNNHLIRLGEGAFQGCSLTTINLSKCIELKVIPAYCFHETNKNAAGNEVIDTIILSNSIEVIGDYAFTGIHATTIFLGTDVKKIGHGALDMNSAGVIILPNSIEEIYSDSIDIGNNNHTVVVVGAREQKDVEALFAVLKEAQVTFKHINNAKQTWAATESFFGKNSTFCMTYLGGHTVDHDSETVKGVRYPDGIDHKGYAMGSCGVCNQMLNTEVEISPIIIAKGYSICTYKGLNAFTNGFEVYHDALNLYEAIYGECELGILFLVNDYYKSEYKDLYKNIDQMGVCIKYLEPGKTVGFVAMDFVLTYSNGLDYEGKDDVPRGEAEVVIAAYMRHTEGNLADTSIYVQDKDDLCIKGATSDGEYYTVSYKSIYGYARGMSEDDYDHDVMYEMVTE